MGRWRKSIVSKSPGEVVAQLPHYYAHTVRIKAGTKNGKLSIYFIICLFIFFFPNFSKFKKITVFFVSFFFFLLIFPVWFPGMGGCVQVLRRNEAVLRRAFGFYASGGVLLRASTANPSFPDTRPPARHSCISPFPLVPVTSQWWVAVGFSVGISRTKCHTVVGVDLPPCLRCITVAF